ncbi:MAG TPA: hypothetical protein VGE24_11415, partial [Emticicia sp.]
KPEKIKASFTTKEGIFTENGKAEYSSSEYRLVSSGPVGNRSLDSIYISAHLKSTVNEIQFPLYFEVPDIDWKRDIQITFAKAYPASVTTDKNKFGVIAGYKDEIQLIANVKAKKGLASKGTPVEFIINGSSGALSSSSNPEYFRALTKTDTNGQASVFFSPRDFNNGLPGKVNYTVKTINEKNEAVTGNGTFEIVLPD